jgi:hypothetical protein
VRVREIEVAFFKEFWWITMAVGKQPFVHWNVDEFSEWASHLGYVILFALYPGEFRQSTICGHSWRKEWAHSGSKV